MHCACVHYVDRSVYSKISMDATAFCSNHVWKRWFWPQKGTPKGAFMKRRFKTPIQNAVHGVTVYAYLEKKPISWACTAHAFTTLTEGGMSNGARAFSAFWIQAIVCSCTCLQRDPKRPFTGVLFMFTSRRRRFREHALRMRSLRWPKRLFRK